MLTSIYISISTWKVIGFYWCLKCFNASSSCFWVKFEPQNYDENIAMNIWLIWNWWDFQTFMSWQLVVISDPHIKIDPDYSVYAKAKEQDFFVRNHEGGDFEGVCWPGKILLYILIISLVQSELMEVSWPSFLYLVDVSWYILSTCMKRWYCLLL